MGIRLCFHNDGEALEDRDIITEFAVDETRDIEEDCEFEHWGAEPTGGDEETQRVGKRKGWENRNSQRKHVDENSNNSQETERKRRGNGGGGNGGEKRRRRQR